MVNALMVRRQQMKAGTPAGNQAKAILKSNEDDADNAPLPF